MKKLLVTLSIGATFLIGCSQSAGDKFVGTWAGTDSCKYEKVIVTKNSGGDKFTVEHLTDTESRTVGSGRMAMNIEARHDRENFVAMLDGEALIIKGKTDLPVKVENNSIEIMGCIYKKVAK